jgi:hypothetical protein
MRALSITSSARARALAAPFPCGVAGNRRCRSVDARVTILGKRPLLDELQSSCPEAGILRMPCLFSTMASLSKIIDVHSHSILAFGENALVQLARGLV